MTKQKSFFGFLVILMTKQKFFMTKQKSIFYDKTKISKENLRVDYYLLLKCCKRQCTLLSLPGPDH